MPHHFNFTINLLRNYSRQFYLLSVNKAPYYFSKLNRNKLTSFIVFFTALYTFSSLQLASASTNSTMTVAWTSRPPSQYIENGVEKGSRLIKLKTIFSKAKIEALFIEEPSKRIWHQFSNNRKNFCSFDWYKTPEREALVQYSTFLEEVPPYSILFNQSNAQKIKEHTNISTLLADTSLQLGLIDSASYGVELEAMIKKSKNQVARYNIIPMILARMISANRASYMFINRQEWEYLKINDIAVNELNLIDMTGIPSGLKSFLVCSKDVDPSIMKKINNAIESTR
jgi:polar amino acid transport system substrate-binding protein